MTAARKKSAANDSAGCRCRMGWMASWKEQMYLHKGLYSVWTLMIVRVESGLDKASTW